MKADIAIVTVLAEEYQAVVSRLSGRGAVRHYPGTAKRPNQYGWVTAELTDEQDRTYRLVVAATIQAGPSHMAGAVAATVAAFEPRYVLLVGIAGGFPLDGLARGDVAVSSVIYDYEYGKIADDFQPRHDFTYQVDGALLRSALTLNARHPAWAEADSDLRPGGGTDRPKLCTGAVASGSKVVDNADNSFFAAVRRSWPKLLAVEMEGAGAAAAIGAAATASRAVGFLMVRGISDMPLLGGAPAAAAGASAGNTAERDTWKRYAAAAAANFVVHWISHAWPHPPAPSRTARTLTGPEPDDDDETGPPPGLPPASVSGLHSGKGAPCGEGRSGGRGLLTPSPQTVPAPPALLVGREEPLRELVGRLARLAGTSEGAKTCALTALRGWPGVGKTSLACEIAHHPEIERAFPGGVLWASLGQAPDVLGELKVWGRALGLQGLAASTDVKEVGLRLVEELRGRQALLVVDDVWNLDHYQPFRVGGRRCVSLVTTRERRIAERLAQAPDEVFELKCLGAAAGLELLARLAPDVVREHPSEAEALVSELEGLPLALQVAGRMLRVEHQRGWSVSELLQELRDCTRLLREDVPPSLMPLVEQTTLSVAALLSKSTDRLTATVRDRYATLGAFASKPATFDLAAMAAVWGDADGAASKATADALIDRGLLEPVGGGRYWMHALLAGHARALCEA